MKFLQTSGIQRTTLALPETVNSIAKAVGADFVVLGFVANYGDLTQEATYYDVRIFEGQKGGLVGWTCERADQVREPSMTISSAATEQMAVLGSYITAEIRKVVNGTKKLAGRAPIVVAPFNESSENFYGAVLARMLATDLMVRSEFTVLPETTAPPSKDDKSLIEWAKGQSAKFVFAGEIEVNTKGLNLLKARQISTDTGKVIHRADEQFASDIDLRVATANLAQRFLEGGERILWRSFTEPGATTPCFADWKIILGCTGPGLKALNPFTGENVWDFLEASYSAQLGERILTPCIFNGKVMGQGISGISTGCFDLKTGKFILFFESGATIELPEERRMAADEEQLFVKTGIFKLSALDTEYKVQWTYSDRSAVKMARGSSSDRIVVASNAGQISALSKSDGKVLWQYRMSDRIWAEPLVANGKVYASSEDGKRVCLSIQDGKEKWLVHGKGRSLCVSAADEKHVYFGDEMGVITCLDAESGQERWKCPLGSAAQGALALYKGALYVPCSNGSLACVDISRGKLFWKINLKAALTSDPVVVPVETLLDNPEALPPDWAENYDHVIYLNSTDGYTYAVGGNQP
ncbi:MAG: PQQ-binding-like beta-propeller repeat protein [Planctomycetota bacterium]|nr:PQQ-binding-like beta-propeller repeat protein [Planctomycetota bacterium]